MAILATQSVLTLDYWKYARHLKIGDWVFDKNGKPVQITLVHEYRAEECFEVTFCDHLTISGDAKLSFRAENDKYRRRVQAFKMIRKNGFKRPLKFMSVEDLIKAGLRGRANRTEWSVPTTKPIQFPAQTHGVPPFVFGFWFFNRKAHKTFTINESTRDFVFKKFKDAGYKVTELNKLRGRFHRFYEDPNIELQMVPNVPTKIPMNYLMGSPEERIELLSGLVNSKPKQYDKRLNNFRITEHNFSIIQQIQGLVESIGCKSNLFYVEPAKSYTLKFKCKHTLVHDQEFKAIKVHHARRFIKKIETLPGQMVVHIETTGDDHSILAGEGYISVC